MNRTEMIAYITERVESASDAELESLYWMIEMEFEN